MGKKALLCIGLQPEKLNLIPRRDAQKIIEWILINQDNYDYTLSLVRKAGNINFERSSKEIEIGNDMTYYDFRVDREIETTGYNAPSGMFSATDSFDIIGVSTGASVLAQAFEFYSAGINFRVLADLCRDRSGLHNQAISIIDAYMPNCLVK